MNPMQVTAGKSAILLPVSQPVVQAALYAAGNVVGTKLTFNNAGQSSLGTGLIQSVQLGFASVQSTQFDVLVFNANPSGSTFTDKAAVTIAAADIPKLIGIVPVTSYSAFAATSAAQARGLAIPFNANTLYVVIVARGGPTFGTTSDVTIALGVSQD